MPDPLFTSYLGGLESPATAHQLIVASGADLAQITRAITSDVTGTVTGILAGPGEVSFTVSVNAGQVYAFRYRVISAFSGGAGTLHGFA
jgi:hypothetical protein